MATPDGFEEYQQPTSPSYVDLVPVEAADPTDPGGREQIITLLRDRQAKLQAALLETERSLAAFMPLGPRQPPSRPARPAGTYTTLRTLIRSLPPGTRFSVAEAYNWAVSNGWETDADDPQKAIASGLSNMVRYGELGKDYRSWYRTPREGHPPPDA